MTVIIWIDPNIDGDDENKSYFKELNDENVGSEIYRAKTVQEGMNQINNILFKETIIIVSGKLFKEFIEEFKKNLNNLCFVPNIIVFTANKNQFLSSLDDDFHNSFIENNFYNSGGVQTDFSKVKEFIKNPKSNKKVILTRDSEEQFNFDYIDTKEKLALPMFYKYLIEFAEQDNNQFLEFLMKNYYDKSKEIKKFLDSMNSTDIPTELLAKYYCRLYTDEESKFYKDLNNDLRKNKRDNYLPYIKVLYEGVKLKSLPLAKKNELYRGSRLPKKEIQNFIDNSKKQKLNGLPGSIVFSKTFLSFTKEKDIALNFIIHTPNSNKLYNTLFILEKDDNINYNLSTHADIEKISLMPDEKEVLFFPFSSFEIKSVGYDKKSELYVIRLLYLGKYLKEIEADQNLAETPINLPTTEFSKQIVESGLIKKENIVNNTTQGIIKTYKTEKSSFAKRVNPVYQKNPIYPVSPIPRTPTFSSVDSTPLESHIYPEYKKNYIIRRFSKGEDTENLYDPPIIEAPKPPAPRKISNLRRVNKENYIIGQFIITENDINKNIRIINSFEQNRIKFHYIKVDNELRYANERELLDKCKIKIDDQEYQFSYFFVFKKPGIYTIEYIFSSNMTRTDFLFAECFNLIYLDLFNFNCEDITNMVCMFLECINLQQIKISNIDTKKVEDMNCMFYGCRSLKYLDLSFFNTQNVINMNRLFFGCNSLTNINLTSFNTQNVVNMYGMFEGCSSLLNLDLMNFYTQNVINMSRMFFCCSSLKSLDLSNFNTNKCAYMNRMFCGCSSLTNLDLSNFNIDNVINMEDMFGGCFSLNIDKIKCKNKGNLIKKSQLYNK